jgi:hypothetical protein
MRTAAMVLTLGWLCLLLLLSSVHAHSQVSANAQGHPFPMLQGTYWTYQGEVRWNDGDHTGTAKISWRTQVRRFLQHGNVRAALINGFPSDVNWSDGKPHPSDSLLVESNGAFYLIAREQLAEAVRRLEQPGDDLAGLLNDDDLILEWPLARGKKFCDADGLARDDGMYCWVVESSGPSALRGLAGIEPGQIEYQLSYRTNPDDIAYTFLPKVGITSYEYHHHGTVADTELKLTEFHRSAQSEE